MNGCGGRVWVEELPPTYTRSYFAAEPESEEAGGNDDTANRVEFPTAKLTAALKKLVLSRVPK